VVHPILTVDVEDWFHVCGVPAYSETARWDSFPSRVERGTDEVLSLLDGSGSTATFFVLGWVARRCPGLVRRISAAGHEVGSHGDLHARLWELPLAAAREDVRKSKATLEQLLGSAVTAYRAPEWSMKSASNPVLGFLAEEGFRVDSSLVAAPPVGETGNPVRPAWIETPSGPILEVPPLTGSFFFRRALLGGGVCSRLSRFSRVRRLVDESLAAGIPPVLYLHPWELDEDHPEMLLPFVSNLVHFAGRGRTRRRLSALLSSHRFGTVSGALDSAPPRSRAA
jgi:polysaccharide deacetylase family protein (PEP-CTERM system associated)